MQLIHKLTINSRCSKMKKSSLVLILIVFSLFLSGCVDSSENDAVLEEYNKYVDTFNEDSETLASLVSEWNSAMEHMSSGDYYTDEEVYELSDIAKRYSSECNFVIAHNSNFETFISTNEDVLKELDVDTYSLKQEFTDSRIVMSDNCESMVEGVETAAQNTEGAVQEAVLNDVVDLLSKFI